MHSMRGSVVKKGVAALALWLVQGCGGEMVDEGSVQQHPTSLQEQQQAGLPEEPEEPGFGRDGLNANDKMVRLNASVPGFGGLFLDEAGRPTLFLKQGADAGRARARLEPIFRGVLEQHQRVAQTLDIRILPGRYEFRELHGWENRLFHTLGTEGMSRLGVDVVNNRVVIGITSESARARVQEVVARQRIPTEAVHIKVIEPSRPARTLSNKWWPPPGGMRVQTDQKLGTNSWATCTLGFNVNHYLYSRSFITAGHCTKVQGAWDGAKFYQTSAYWASFDYVGKEVLDPGYFTGGECPAGSRCRYSDAALVGYDPSRTLGRLGQLAMPYSRCTYGLSSSIFCDPTISDLFYNVINDTFVSALVVGQQVDKIGITTGQTTGQITDVCWKDYSGDAILLCQYAARAGVDGGDSGAPVFIHSPTGNVQAVGILWGNGSATDDIFLFSLLSGVQTDLGGFAIR